MHEEIEDNKLVNFYSTVKILKFKIVLNCLHNQCSHYNQ
jgi:hypothetical protein